MKKKLLIITRWYLPATKSGGTVRSLVALVDGLKEDFDISIVTSDRDLGATEPYEGVVFDRFVAKSGVKIIYLSALGVGSVAKAIEKIQPNIIYVNSFFDLLTQSLMLLKVSGKISAPILVAPRGELGKGALSIKATKKKLYLGLYKLLGLSRGVTFHATSPEDRKDIVAMFPKSKVIVIPNAKEEVSCDLSLPQKVRGSLRMVFVSRIAPVKNLHYALEVLRDFPIEGEVLFDIYGPDEDHAYWEQCQTIIKQLPNTIKVHYQGFLEPSKIQEGLSRYHLFFLPTKGENFGHAIVEAMQVGLIPLISDKTPWQDLASHTAGYSLPLSHPDRFAQAINEVMDYDQTRFTEVSHAVKAYIDNHLDNQGTLNRYRDAFTKMGIQGL